MKKLLCLSALFAALSASGQDCKNYYFLQNNKTVEMTIYNKKGDPSGKQVYTISGVSSSGGTTSGTVNSEMFDKKGKSIAKATSIMKCSGGALMVDMKMLMPQQQQEQYAKAEAKADNIYIEYPSHMAAGDQLKDGTFHLDMNTGGLDQSINMVVSERKVEAKESITTPAGTWDCVKISYKSKMTIRTAGIGIPMSFDGTEWYAPGFGVVKTESKYGKTEITGIR